MRVSLAILAAAMAMSTAVGAQAQQATPVARVCLAAYSEAAGQARYRVTVDWGALPADRYARVDLAARDASGAFWPQLHSERLRPGKQQGTALFTVSDVSQYPLDFFLIGMSEAARRDFDLSCRREGFCSLALPVEGIETLGQGASISGPKTAPRC
ncbi:hypothetical protein AS593_12015 [Caulobacter vibrioides]|nr:hypothetical protein AS593_12015 [Caulobacter vibrioides]